MVKSIDVTAKSRRLGLTSLASVHRMALPTSSSQPPWSPPPFYGIKTIKHLSHPFGKQEIFRHKDHVTDVTVFLPQPLH